MIFEKACFIIRQGFSRFYESGTMLLDLSDMIIELVAIIAPEERSFASLRMTLEEMGAFASLRMTLLS